MPSTLFFRLAAVAGFALAWVDFLPAAGALAAVFAVVGLFGVFAGEAVLAKATAMASRKVVVPLKRRLAGRRWAKSSVVTMGRDTGEAAIMPA